MYTICVYESISTGGKVYRMKKKTVDVINSWKRNVVSASFGEYVTVLFNIGVMIIINNDRVFDK